MPPIPSTSPATSKPIPPTSSFIHTTSFSFVDTRGRTLLLRGVNLSGASKAPVGQLSHVLDGFWEGVGYPPGEEGEEEEEDRMSVHSTSSSSSSTTSTSTSSLSSSSSSHAQPPHPTNTSNNPSPPPNKPSSNPNDANPSNNPKKKNQKISFTNRPLNLSDGSADVHLARLRGWGFNLLRFPFTWEGLEHEGPGKYDYEYMDYIIQCLLKCKEYGFRVYMDPHQDTWSRFSGGSGAPFWTLPACGIDPRNITATQAALLHCEYPTTPYYDNDGKGVGNGRDKSQRSTPTPSGSRTSFGEKPTSPSTRKSASPSSSSSSSENPPDPTPTPNPSSLPAMSWSTNYGRLLSQTLFTLFFAGRDFAPLCVIDGVNVQDWLQDRFLRACGELVKRIGEWDEGVRRGARGNHNSDELDEEESEHPHTLLDSCVIGWDSLNEPFEGLVGWSDLSLNPSAQGSTLKKGTYPTPVQGMRLGMGQRERVEHWSFGAMGPRRDGWVEVDPKGRKVWADAAGEGGEGEGGEVEEEGRQTGIPAELPDGTHPLYGWKRNTSSWKLGTCIWAQHGVWDPPTGYLLRPDYFSLNPQTSLPVEFMQDYWKPFFLAYSQTIRAHHPEAIVFVQPPVFAVPPRFSEKELGGRAAYSPHYYDGLTLVTRHWNWFNADALGLLRGRYRSALGAVKVGEGAIRKSLHEQLGYLQADVANFPEGVQQQQQELEEIAEAELEADEIEETGSPLGGPNTRGYPTLIGEIGTPFDMDAKRSYGWTDGGKYKGDYTNQERALDASLQACDAWLDKGERERWERERKGKGGGNGGKGNGGGGGKEEYSNTTNKGDSLNYTVWTYVPDDHTHEWGDGWNMEDLSLFSVHDLVHSDVDDDDELDEEDDEEEEEEEEEEGGEECRCDESCCRGEDVDVNEDVDVDEDGGVLDDLQAQAQHSRAGLLMAGEREADHDHRGAEDGEDNNQGGGRSCGEQQLSSSLMKRCCRLHRLRRRQHQHHHEHGITSSNATSTPKSESSSKETKKTKKKSKTQQQQQQQQPKTQPMSTTRTAALASSSLSVASLGFGLGSSSYRSASASSTGLGLGADVDMDMEIHRRRTRGGRTVGAGVHPYPHAYRDQQQQQLGRQSMLSVVSSVSESGSESGASTCSSGTRTGDHRRHEHEHEHEHKHHKPQSLRSFHSKPHPKTNPNPIPLPLRKAGYHPNPYTFLTNGARAVRAFARPYPVAVVGRAVDVRFDVGKGVFRMVVWVGWEDAPPPTTVGGLAKAGEGEREERVATEVFLPLVHYAHPRLLSSEYSSLSSSAVQEQRRRNQYAYAYPPGPQSQSQPQVQPQLQPHPQTHLESQTQKERRSGKESESLESSLATLTPHAHFPAPSPPLMTTKTSEATTGTGTTLMASSSPSPRSPGVKLSDEEDVKKTVGNGNADSRYPPHTNVRAPLLIRDVDDDGLGSLLIDVEVTLSTSSTYTSSSSSSSFSYPSSSSYPSTSTSTSNSSTKTQQTKPPHQQPPLSPGHVQIKGQTLLWWYDVPKKGEGRREYVLEVRRRGGVVLPSPKVLHDRRVKVREGRVKERRREKEKEKRTRMGRMQGEDDGDEERQRGCWESLCDEQGCVIA